MVLGSQHENLFLTALVYNQIILIWGMYNSNTKLIRVVTWLLTFLSVFTDKYKLSNCSLRTIIQVNKDYIKQVDTIQMQKLCYKLFDFLYTDQSVTSSICRLIVNERLQDYLPFLKKTLANVSNPTPWNRAVNNIIGSYPVNSRHPLFIQITK